MDTDDVVAGRKQRCAILGGMLLDAHLIIHDTNAERKILTTYAECLCAWRIVSANGPQSISEIARNTRLSRSAVREAVDRLAVQGLVRRNGEGVTIISDYYLNEMLDELQQKLTTAITRAADQLR